MLAVKETIEVDWTVRTTEDVGMYVTVYKLAPLL